MSLPMKVICINDKNKPKEIPAEKWITEGKIYTVVGVQQLLSSNSMGFELAEIKLDESCFPYHYFNPNRFEFYDDVLMENLENEIFEILNPNIA